jgi:hypothetical protein
MFTIATCYAKLSSISIAVNNRFIIIPEHEVAKIKNNKKDHFTGCFYSIVSL